MNTTKLTKHIRHSTGKKNKFGGGSNPLRTQDSGKIRKVREEKPASFGSRLRSDFGKRIVKGAPKPKYSSKRNLVIVKPKYASLIRDTENYIFSRYRRQYDYKALALSIKKWTALDRRRNLSIEPKDVGPFVHGFLSEKIPVSLQPHSLESSVMVIRVSGVPGVKNVPLYKPLKDSIPDFSKMVGVFKCGGNVVDVTKPILEHRCNDGQLATDDYKVTFTPSGRGGSTALVASETSTIGDMMPFMIKVRGIESVKAISIFSVIVDELPYKGVYTLGGRVVDTTKPLYMHRTLDDKAPTPDHNLSYRPLGLGGMDSKAVDILKVYSPRDEIPPLARQSKHDLFVADLAQQVGPIQVFLQIGDHRYRCNVSSLAHLREIIDKWFVDARSLVHGFDLSQVESLGKFAIVHVLPRLFGGKGKDKKKSPQVVINEVIRVNSSNPRAYDKKQQPKQKQNNTKMVRQPSVSMNSQIGKRTPNMGSEFLKSQANPFKFISRVPDSYSLPTASFRLESAFTPTADSSGTLSFAVLPNIYQTVMMANGVVSTVNQGLLKSWSTDNRIFGMTSPTQMNEYSSWRITSAAIALESMANANTVQGSVTAGLLPCLPNGGIDLAFLTAGGILSATGYNNQFINSLGLSVATADALPTASTTSTMPLNNIVGKDLFVTMPAYSGASLGFRPSQGRFALLNGSWEDVTMIKQDQAFSTASVATSFNFNSIVNMGQNTSGIGKEATSADGFMGAFVSCTGLVPSSSSLKVRLVLNVEAVAAPTGTVTSITPAQSNERSAVGSTAIVETAHKAIWNDPDSLISVVEKGIDAWAAWSPAIMKAISWMESNGAALM